MKTKYYESLKKVIDQTSKDFSPNDKILQDFMKSCIKAYSFGIKKAPKGK